VETLVGYLSGELLGGQQGAGPQAPPSGASSAAVLEKIEELSEDEVERLLASKIGEGG
jgi:hypothetical protein